MSLRTTLIEYGLRVNDLIAGFGGSVVAAVVMRNVTPLQALGTVIVGTFSANYFTDPAARMVGVGEGPAGFLVGLTGMFICQALIEAVRKWRPTIPGISDGK